MPFINNHSQRAMIFSALLILLVAFSPAALAQRLGAGNTGVNFPEKIDQKISETASEATKNYVVKYGVVSMSVVVANSDARNVISPIQSDLAKAVQVEIQSQLPEYTNNMLVIRAIEFSEERAKRIAQRQNKSEPSETFRREMIELASAPYLMAIMLAPDKDRQKDAGLVTLELVEVATGRVIASVSEQYYQKDRAQKRADAIVVQHNVTTWLNELMGPKKYCNMLNGPHFATLQFVGDIPVNRNRMLKKAISEATGVFETAIRLDRSKEGFDVVKTELFLQHPPHVMTDLLIEKFAELFEEDKMTCEPLRQVGGDMIFAVTDTPKKVCEKPSRAR